MSLFADGLVMNAACSVAKTFEDIEALAKTNIDIVTIGSITVEARAGNPEPRWYDNDTFAINSFGMPNEGLEYYKEHLPTMIETIHASSKKVNLSIAGFSIDDYAQLAVMADNASVDYLELNLGCPNVQIDGKQKPIASFDVEYMTSIINLVSGITKVPLLIKLSPYSNPAELQSVAAVLAELPIAAVVTSNTFANAHYSVDHEPVVAMTFGGLSGASLKPIALGQVVQFSNVLPEHISVIGVGGIETKADADLYFGSGASAVQVATLIVREGHAAIDKVIS